MAFGFSLGGKASKSKSKNRVYVPDGSGKNQVNVLDPVQNAASTYESGLNRLTGFAGEDRVANLDQNTLDAMDMAKSRINDPNGAYATATGALSDAAGGMDVRDLYPILQELDKFGIDVSQFMDPNAMQAFQDSMAGDQFGLQDLAGSEIPAEVIQSLTKGDNLLNPERLASLTGGAVPDETLSYLKKVIGGDYLAGGEGFNAAVQAAENRAIPKILSVFGSSGAGGGDGGLSRAAVGQSSVDAFASQYGAERQLQQGAAGDLANFTRLNRDSNRDYESTVADIGLKRAGLYGDLTQADARRRGDVSGRLTDNRDRAATTLFDATDRERNRDLDATLAEAGFDAEERGRMLQAARDLPGVANADIDLLSSIGDRLQSQEQAELDKPEQLLMRQIEAALGGFPIEALLGSNTKGKSSGFGFGFNANNDDPFRN